MSRPSTLSWVGINSTRNADRTFHSDGFYAFTNLRGHRGYHTRRPNPWFYVPRDQKP